MPRAPRTHAELTPPPAWPLSRLYHENSKLTERRALALREQIELFSDAESGPPGGPGVYPSRKTVELPRVRRRLLGPRLDDTLRSRRSPRGPFEGAPVRLVDLAALLDLSVGVTAPAAGGAAALRAYPSAGGLYPLEVYLVAVACPPLEAGLYHHDTNRRALAFLAPCPPVADLKRLVFADDLWPTAAAALVFTAVLDRTQAKYGERGYRFALLEAGHAAQNVLLAATSLGLSAAPIGGFCEDALGAALGLDAHTETPVYVVLLGR